MTRQTWRDRVGLQVAFSILFVMLLRLPSLGWAVISDDEAIYDAMAQVINSGGVMYRDAVDHKPPGLAYVYAAVERLAGLHSAGMLGIQAVHLFGVLLTALTVFGLFALSRELLKRELRWVAPVLYGLVSSTRCAYDGLALNGEILMNTPTVFAILAVIWAGKSRGVRRALLDLSAGALMGLAGLAKWQALVAGLAFPFLGFDGSAFLKRLFQRGPFWLLGLMLPVGAAAFYFNSHGVLAEFLQWGGLFNLRYISEGPDFIWALKRLGTQLAAVVLPSIAFYAAASYGLFVTARKQIGLSNGSDEEQYAVNPGIFVWAIVSILSVAIGGRFFGHYFLQAELPLCLIAAGPLYQALRSAPKTVGTAIAVPALFFFAISLAPQATRAIFDSGEPDWERVGQAISLQSKPTDTLFVWGNVPALYYYSHRKMGTRFSFCNYLTGLSPGTRSEYDPSYLPAQVSEAWPLLLQDLKNRRPAMILDTATAGWKSYGKFGISRYPELQAFLKAHYRALDRSPASLGGATLYRRID